MTLIATLGATALLAITGKASGLTKLRGLATFGNRQGYITVHPSAILRAPSDQGEADDRTFVADMQAIRQLAGLA